MFSKKLIELKNNDVSTLDLSHMRIEDDNAKSLAEALMNTVSLRRMV
jgi:hypothetical protein